MPEEVNRIVTDALADLLLVTEPSGQSNLHREGVDPSRIHLVGNLMIDTLLRELPRARALETPARFGLGRRGFGLVTLHRPGNVDDPDTLAALTALLVDLSESLPLVFPVHPRTRGRIEAAGLWDDLRTAPGVVLTGPLGYHENLGLLDAAKVVLTDSGGVQEETSALGTPCLTLRENTERPITTTMGTNTLVGNDSAKIRAGVLEVIAGRYKAGAPIPLWDGRAAGRAADVLRAAWRLGAPAPEPAAEPALP
jgi:UDP-N-acetylglucosamine 2-epimerase (non-hydrolysing)